jgi:uncharacterized membrane protein
MQPKWHLVRMATQTEKKESELDRLFSIPASGVVFASGGALIGNTIGGPLGGLVGGAIGAVGGVVTEIVSQKRHRMNSSDS